jgi:hypothetical protein
MSQVCFHWKLIHNNKMFSILYAVPILKTRPRLRPLFTEEVAAESVSNFTPQNDSQTPRHL